MRLSGGLLGKCFNKGEANCKASSKRCWQRRAALVEEEMRATWRALASKGGNLLVSGGGKLQVESTSVEWWPLVIGVLWKRNREDRDERDEKTKREREREREISVMRRERK